LPANGAVLPLAVRGDRDALTEILRSLLERAVESLGGAPGTVRIALRPVTGLLEVTVEDNGRGLSEILLSKLEARGFSTASGKMTLLQMREAGLRWGWNLELQARLGVGTRVTLEMPRADIKAIQEDADRRRELRSPLSSDPDSRLG
jgi:signal transduction histidine kinase